MDERALLIDLFDRVDEHVEGILAGLDATDLTRQPGPGTNPIGWLVWHIGRVEDAQVAAITGDAQVWADAAWAPRFGLDPDPANTGYGHAAADVAAVRPQGTDALREYMSAVRTRTRRLIDSCGPGDLDRIVDRAWDPPVTMGVRLISIADDQIQHAGAAAYVKGLFQQG